MAFSESIDFMHIYDVKSLALHQEIDVFGEIAGFDTYGENKLFVAVKEAPNLSCVMEYKVDNSVEKVGSIQEVNQVFI